MRFRWRLLLSSDFSMLDWGEIRVAAERSIDGSSTDPQDLTDLDYGHVLLVLELSSCSEFIFGQHGRFPTSAAPCASCGRAGSGTFSDEVTFEFRQRGKIWKTSRPPEDKVSMFSCRDRNSMPRSCSSDNCSMSRRRYRGKPDSTRLLLPFGLKPRPERTPEQATSILAASGR